MNLHNICLLLVYFFPCFGLLTFTTANFPPVWTTAALHLCATFEHFFSQRAGSGYLSAAHTSVQVGPALLSLHNNSAVCIPERMNPTAARDKEDSCLQTFDNQFWAPFGWAYLQVRGCFRTGRDRSPTTGISSNPAYSHRKISEEIQHVTYTYFICQE